MSTMPRGSRLSALHRWIVARIHRVLEKFLRVHRPELADLVIGFDGLVDHFAALLLGAPDKHVADYVGVVVEADRPARRLCERDRTYRLDERIWIFGLAAGLR